MTNSKQPKYYFIPTSLAIGASLFALQNHNRAPSRIDPPVLPTHSHRRLSVALPNGGCEITWPKPPPPNIEITYAASYPGCGARMTWNLVEALTGLETGDDWNNNGRGDKVVTLKTHYPQSNGILPVFDDKIHRAFLVVRNPMDSIPSYFNHIYEMRNHLPVHSERAPLEEWIKWRDHYLEDEIAEYKKFTIFWMDRYTPKDRYVITYEGLTDDLIGAEVTKGLSEFLGTAEGVTPIDSESVPCVWRAVVKNEPPEQQKEYIERLHKAKEGSEKEKGGTAAGVGAVSVGSASNGANPVPPALQTAAAPSNGGANPAVEQVKPVEQQVNQQFDAQPIQQPQQASPGSEESLQTVYLDQTQQQLEHQQPQLQGSGHPMPVDNSTPFQQPKTQQEYQPNAETQTQYQPTGETQTQYQKQFPVQQYGQYPELTQQQPVQQYGQYSGSVQQQPVQQYGQYSGSAQQQPVQQYGQYPELAQQQPAPMQYQQSMQTVHYGQQQGNLRRRLDPGHHDSQRKGPNVARPYTVKQLELMMKMLHELKERYQDDIRLNNIMMGYYEKVEKAKNELVAGGAEKGGGKLVAPPGGFY